MAKKHYSADARPRIEKGQPDAMEDMVSSSVGEAQADGDRMTRTKDILFKEDPGLTKSHAIGMGPGQITTDSLESSTLLQDSLQEIQETNSLYTGTDSEKMCTELDDISTSSHNITIGDEQSFEIELHDSQFPKSAVIYVTNDALASSEGNLFSFPIEDLQPKDSSTFTDGALIFIRSEDISGIQYAGEGPITSEIPQECLADPQTSIVYSSASELHVANISNVNCRRTDRVDADQHGLAQILEIKAKSKDNTPEEEIQTLIGMAEECVSINHDVHASLGETHSSRNILPQNNASVNETLSGVNKAMVDDKNDANKASLSVMKDGDFDQGQKSFETLMGEGFYKDGTANKSDLDNNNEQQCSEMPISQPVAVNTEILKVNDNIVLINEHPLSVDKQQLMASGLNSKSSQILMNISPANDPARDKKIVFIPMITSQGITPQILVAKQLSTDAGRVAAEVISSPCQSKSYVVPSPCQSKSCVLPSPCQSKSYVLPSPKLSTDRELGKCTQGIKLPNHMAGKRLVIIQCQKPLGKAEIKPFEKINSQRLINVKGKDSTEPFVISSHGVVATDSQSILNTNRNTSGVISKVDAATETDESLLRQHKDNTGIGHMNDQSEVLKSVSSQEKISKSLEVTKSRNNSIEVSESVNEESLPKINACNEGQEVNLVLEHEEDDFHFQGNNLTIQSSKKRKISKKEDKNGDMDRSEEKEVSFVKPSDKEVQKSLAAHTGIDRSFKKDRRQLGKVESKMDSKVKNMKDNILKETECNVSSVRNDSLQLQSYTKRDARRPRVDYKNLNSGVFSLKRMLPSTVFEKPKLSSMNVSDHETTDKKQIRKKILHSEENKDKTKSQKSVHLNSELSKKGGRKGSKGEFSQSLPEASEVEKRKGRDRSDGMSSSLEVKPGRKRCKLQGKFKARGKVSPDKNELNHPVDVVHDDVTSDLKDEPQTVVCEWCEKPYASHKSLAAHRKCCKMSPNARPKPHICEICNKGFATSLYLKQHAAVHTGIKKYICKVCNKGFSNQGNLYTHMGIHNPNKRFLCAHCGKGFSQHVNLKYHLKTASVGKCAADRKDCPFTCEKCGNRFTSNKRLKQHEQIHQKYKIESFSCEHCQRVFKSYPLLERHVRIHTGLKPFKCKVCNMAFAQQNNLEAHALTHSDVRPYHCAICQRGFIQRTNFKTHMWKKHGLAPNILPRMRTKSRKKDASNTSFQFILLENETNASISQGQWTQTVDDGTDTDLKSSTEDSRS